ncbi:ribonuclease H-like domain-containing protein [Tanacetum coccineum]
MFSKNDDATSHKTFFDDFQTDIQASNPNDDGGEPSGINIGSESDSDDTANEIMIKNQCRWVKKTSLRVQAMNEEMNALYENNTWDHVELPRNRRAIGSKWVYKTKIKSTGEIDRYKARLVAKGLSEALIETGFKQSGHDHSLYTKESGGGLIALFVYVDDIFLTGNNIYEINNVKTVLSSKFKSKDLGELKYFLGIEVLKTDKGSLCLSQRKYYLELLHDYGLLACKPVYTPLFENIIIAHKEKEGDKFLKNVTNYQRLVGKLIYLTLTRPDISYSVHCLSQHMHAPLQSYMDLGLRVISVAIQIAANPIMHEKTKHFALDVHIVREKVALGLIKIAKIDYEN